MEHLESARGNLGVGRHDVAGVEAEITAQLSMEALIAFPGFEHPYDCIECANSWATSPRSSARQRGIYEGR